MWHVGGRRKLVAIALLGVVAGVAARLRRIEITGESMVPALEPGDRVVVVRGGRPRTGDLVACVDPRDPKRTMVKRVAAVPGGAVRVDGAVHAAGAGYVVLGDNPAASTDSRHFGPIDIKLIIGRLIFQYFPERRARLIWRAAPASR